MRRGSGPTRGQITSAAGNRPSSACRPAVAKCLISALAKNVFVVNEYKERSRTKSLVRPTADRSGTRQPTMPTLAIQPPQPGPPREGRDHRRDPSSDGTKPNRTRNGTKPNRARDGTKPNRARDGTKPNRARDGTKPNRAGDGTKPNWARNGTKPNRARCTWGGLH
jgi:hypothetical protein